MGGPGAAEFPTLLELVDPSRWQRLQGHFASVLGVLLRTVSPTRELLVAPSWPAGLDADLAVRLLKIGEEIESLLPLNDPPRTISSLTTRLGITYALVPICATAGHVTTYILVGPIVVGQREDELQFHQRVNAMGLDAQALWPLLLSLKLYTFAGIRSALNLLEEVGTSIAQVAYQARQLAAMLPVNQKIDQAVVTYHTDRVLHSLLEAATLATKADGGSVMVFTPQHDTLQIKVAQGLSDHVMASTRLKTGEGIAGLAASQRRIMLVDDQTTDQDLKGRMRRSGIISSLVAPLTVDSGQEPVGVLNLRTANPQRRFTQEHVELLRRLLDLTSIALGHLRFVFNQARTTSS